MQNAHIFTSGSLSQAPRGLSAEEKRVKLLEIFHETVGVLCWAPCVMIPMPSRKTSFRQVFYPPRASSGPLMIIQQLKELEKLGPKMKGIGDYSHIFSFSTDFCHFRLTRRGDFCSRTVRQGSLTVARRRQPRSVGQNRVVELYGLLSRHTAQSLLFRLMGDLHPNALAVFWNFPSQRGAIVSHVVSTSSVPAAAAD